MRHRIHRSIVPALLAGGLLLTFGLPATSSTAIALSTQEAVAGFEYPEKRAADLGLKVPKRKQDQSNSVCTRALNAQHPAACFENLADAEDFVVAKKRDKDDGARSDQEILLTGSGGQQLYLNGAKARAITCYSNCFDANDARTMWYSIGTGGCTHFYPQNDLYAEYTAQFTESFFYADSACRTMVAYRSNTQAGGGAKDCGVSTAPRSCFFQGNLYFYNSFSIHYGGTF